MAELPRPTPESRVLELTRQLAEDYHSIPLPEVGRVVRDAAATTIGPDGRWDGTAEGLPAVMAVIEALSRDELDELASGVSPAPTAPAPRGARRSGPRRGAA